MHRPTTRREMVPHTFSQSHLQPSTSDLFRTTAVLPMNLALGWGEFLPIFNGSYGYSIFSYGHIEFLPLGQRTFPNTESVCLCLMPRLSDMLVQAGCVPFDEVSLYL